MNSVAAMHTHMTFHPFMPLDPVGGGPRQTWCFAPLQPSTPDVDREMSSSSQTVKIKYHVNIDSGIKEYRNTGSFAEIVWPALGRLFCESIVNA